MVQLVAGDRRDFKTPGATAALATTLSILTASNWMNGV